MTDFVQQQVNGSTEPQCQFYVARKKRLCRMTVKPGRSYCGEHEPQPKTTDGQDDTRILCPNDPKHTCYVSKLEKHLLICNARPVEQPPYIIQNINSPAEGEVHHRLPLSQLSKETILKVIEKVNTLFEKHIKENIETAPDFPIHSAVLEEFSESDRTESSLRHLRQVSSLLWLTEREGLVQDNTCYVELGAGKGQVSYYVWRAWCGAGSSALLVDRASLRHKRDNKLPNKLPNKPPNKPPDKLSDTPSDTPPSSLGVAQRLRADLRHLQLDRLEPARRAAALLGLAKHLCGVATDYALRCVSGARAASGLVLATCCHHRCDRAAYVANARLLELGIDGAELNVMLGIVSWATCGDGRSRTRPASPARVDGAGPDGRPVREGAAGTEERPARKGGAGPEDRPAREGGAGPEERSARESGAGPEDRPAREGGAGPEERSARESGAGPEDRPAREGGAGPEERSARESGAGPEERPAREDRLVLPREYREEVGRRAKRLLDWGRVLYLRERGFDARLCYYVPSSVSLENVCIIAKKRS